MSYDDKPIAHREDGSPIYDNTPTVVVVAFTRGTNNDKRVLAIRRNTNPGKGLWALPGGYHMRGETWQEAGSRELREETGYVAEPSSIIADGIVTDHYGNNVILANARYEAGGYHSGDPFNENEILEIQFMNEDEVNASAGFWAFPTHLAYAVSLFRT